MSHLILGNDQISGISVNGVKQILSQFADDTAAFLKYDQMVIKAFVDTLSHVENQIGLKVSYEKTTIYRVGSLRRSNAKLFTQKDFKWSNDAIQLLGVKINGDGSICNENFDVIISKVKNICSQWMNRNLTLYGKVLVVNTLIGSLFVYKMSTMLNMTDRQINTVEGVIREYIWTGKKPKISFELLKKNKIHGGLRLVDLKAKQNALKCGYLS